MRYEIKERNVLIEAAKIEMGENVRFGRDVSIRVRGKFSLGRHSFVGDRFRANAEELSIGEYFYNNPTDCGGMIIGGGGSNFPYAKLTIGARCVCHTGQINLARPVEIGDDVGLSHDVDLITHGFWYSVLQGYPAVFEGISLGSNVILGWKSIVMPGVRVCDNVVIGAHSTVTKSIREKGIYAGTPAKLIRGIVEPTKDEKLAMVQRITAEFIDLMDHYKTGDIAIQEKYPTIRVNSLTIDLEKLSCSGDHDDVSNAFRDFLRRYGIRVYAPPGFAFNLEKESMKLLNFDRALCLSPHPDDVEYSMSATIRKFPGTTFDVLCLSCGTSTDDSSTSERIEEVKLFWKTFGSENVNLSFSKHHSLDGLNHAQLITYIENTTIKKKSYDAIFVPSGIDSHFEHRMVNDAGPALIRNNTLSLIEYRCSSTLHEWAPNLFIDVEAICAEKIGALQACFRSQIDSYYFKPQNLELFHNDFISNKKAIACREFFRSRTLHA